MANALVMRVWTQLQRSCCSEFGLVVDDFERTRHAVYLPIIYIIVHVIVYLYVYAIWLPSFCTVKFHVVLCAYEVYLFARQWPRLNSSFYIFFKSLPLSSSDVQTRAFRKKCAILLLKNLYFSGLIFGR